MNKTVGNVTLIVYVAVAICVASTQPTWVDDTNSFLSNFVNHELLNLLGVILAITLASVVNIHFEFNKIEERYQREGALKVSRENLKRNTTVLIALFLIAVALVIVKPLVAVGSVGQALTNMGALMIVLWHVLILISLTQLAFAIPPDIRPQPEAPTPPAEPVAVAKAAVSSRPKKTTARKAAQ